MGLNSVSIVGRLTADPDMRYLDSGKAIASFSIACNRNKEDADFFQCEAWDKTAEIIGQWCRKGSQIGISGRLKQERWDDKQTGDKRSKVVISAMQIELLGTKQEDGASTPAPTSAPSAPPQQPVAPAVRQPVASTAATTAEVEPDYDLIPF